LLIVLGIFLIVGAIVRISSVKSEQSKNSGRTEAKTPEQSRAEAVAKQKSELRFQLAVLGAKALRNSARNPDSFKLSQARLMDDGAACYTYRAQNGFGGMNIGHAVLSPAGTILSEDAAGFTRLWNKECRGKTGEEKAWEVGYAAGLHGLFDGSE
jgi:hypothetical protein